MDRLIGVIGVDGSLMPVQVRDGLPSVHYGYAQAAAIWLDIEAMESQRKERFVNPVVLHNAVNSALVSLDLPLASLIKSTTCGPPLPTSVRPHPPLDDDLIWITEPALP